MIMQLAVLGSPITHSLSPLIHSLAYSRLGILAEYSRFEVTAAGLADFLGRHQDGSWRGFSITMPLKEAVVPLLTDLAERVAVTGSANTIVFQDGGWFGHNTDVLGFERLVSGKRPGSISILGAGGTARSALYAVRDLGVPISIFRRDQRRDEALLRVSPSIEIRDWRDIGDAFSSTLVINAAPIDAASDYLSVQKPVELVIDALYSPWPPPLRAMQSPESYISGKELLVAQALEQIRIFAAMEAVDDTLYAPLLAAINPQ